MYTRYYSISLCLFYLLLSCSTPRKMEKNAAIDNRLTPLQEKSGWTLLFDGRTLNGWRTFKNKKSDSWSVEDGVLHCKPGEGTGGQTPNRADLITVDKYENFELQIDWKIAPQGNSGII